MQCEQAASKSDINKLLKSLPQIPTKTD